MTPGPPGGLRARDALAALGVAFAFLALCAFGLRRLEELAPPGHVTLGVVADPHLVDMTALYGSFAREAAEGGGLLVHNHMTAEPHEAVQARPWDWFVGKLGAALGAGPHGFVRLDRVLAACLFALAWAFLLGETVASSRVRALGVVAAFFGGSLYWIWELAGRDALGGGAAREWLRLMGDLSGLGFAFPVLLAGVPHLMLELVFFAAAAAFLLRSVRRDSDADALGAGLAILLQCGVRPYTVPVSLACAAVVLGREALRAGPGGRARWLRRLALAVLPALPLVAHYYRIVRGETVFSSLDVYHPAPAFHEQVLFFGVPAFVAALLVVPRVRARRRELGRTPGPLPALLSTWAACELLLVHGEALPAPLTVGWEVEAMLPLPLLALLLALLVADTARPRALAAAGLPLLLLHAVPTLAFAAETAREVQRPASALLLRADERAALARLEELRPEDAMTADRPPFVLLAHPDLGPLVPWLAGVRVYLGHPDHTPGSGAKRAQVLSFYGDGRGAPALAERGVTHVLVGPRERALAAPEDAGAFAREAGPHLAPLLEEGEVRVHALRPAGGAR